MYILCELFVVLFWYTTLSLKNILEKVINHIAWKSNKIITVKLNVHVKFVDFVFLKR